MPNEEGLMVAELGGEEDNYNAGIKYLVEKGVDIQPLSEDVCRDEKKCNQCSACVSICPTGALAISVRKTMEVLFDVEKCVACSLCVPICPPRAMNVTLNGLEDFGIQKLI
jgi:L-aspartate semialdehyde sulfurtransferase ferredoxin